MCRRIGEAVIAETTESRSLRKTKVITIIGARLARRCPAFESFSASNEVKEVDDVLGAFFMIRKEVIDKIGLLDERFWMCREESDFAYRTRKAGYKVFYNPHATVVHIGSSSAHATRERKVRHYCQDFISANYFYRKHYSILKQLLLKAIILQAFSTKMIMTTIGYFFYASIRDDLKKNMVQYLDALKKVMTNSTERAI
jgi:GT2 family glycosyltransferase